jgi:hypothetical protein
VYQAASHRLLRAAKFRQSREPMASAVEVRERAPAGRTVAGFTSADMKSGEKWL